MKDVGAILDKYLARTERLHKRNREAGKGHEMTNDHKLAKRAHKLGYRYITRWPVRTTGTEHILEHKDGDRHFRSMDEVECFIGEQEIAKLERQTK